MKDFNYIQNDNDPILKHVPLVVNIMKAQGVYRNNKEFHDCLQSGLLAIVEARKTYKKYKGEFSTHMFYKIRKNIQEQLTLCNPFSYGCVETLKDNAHEKKHGKITFSSLNQVVERDNGDNFLCEFIEDINCKHPYENIDKKFFLEVLNKSLTKEEKRVISVVFKKNSTKRPMSKEEKKIIVDYYAMLHYKRYKLKYRGKGKSNYVKIKFLLRDGFIYRCQKLFKDYLEEREKYEG